ncbi:MAG: sigma-70 family RNA polymerase sigma factor [Bacteroidales bacterium]|jgi:RNA polymerase sigma factor (sigma-70 family)
MYSDKEIMEGILKKNNAIIQYVYTEYFPKISQHLLKNQILNKDDAYELFQESMIVCWENIRDGKVDFQKKFFPYLFGICRNLLLMRLRQKDNKAIVTEIDPDLLPIETDGDMLDLYPINDKVFISDEEIQSEIFSRCFNKLKDDCREVLKLAFSGVAISEIAKRMRYDASFVKLKKHRCKEYLRESIKQDKWYSLLKKHLK